MPSSIGVDSEKEIKLFRCSLDNAVEITTLKGRIKDIVISVSKRRIGALESTIEESGFYWIFLFLR